MDVKGKTWTIIGNTAFSFEKYDLFHFSLGPDEMEILLQFMYGAIVELPPGASARYCMSTHCLKLENWAQKPT